MKRTILAVLGLLALLIAVPAYGQTPAPAQNTMSFNIGASALGLAATQNATPASDIVLSLNPGFKSAVMQNFALRSDNLLAPGANLQYYGGGVNFTIPYKFAAGNVFAPLSFYVDGTVGADRIVPATGPSASHVAFMAGGGANWQTSSGVQINLVEINLLHTPSAPWGSNAPAISGGISYVFGKH